MKTYIAGKQLIEVFKKVPVVNFYLFTSVTRAQTIHGTDDDRFFSTKIVSGHTNIDYAIYSLTTIVLRARNTKLRMTSKLSVPYSAVTVIFKL